MNENLFSYGTLRNGEVQLELFKRLLRGAKDILNGYKLARIEIEDKAFLAKGEDKFQLTLIPTNNNSDFVEGWVFEISREELLLADEYEPDDYKRIKVALASGKEAWLYAAAKIT